MEADVEASLETAQREADELAAAREREAKLSAMAAAAMQQAQQREQAERQEAEHLHALLQVLSFDLHSGQTVISDACAAVNECIVWLSCSLKCTSSKHAPEALQGFPKLCSLLTFEVLKAKHWQYHAWHL